MIILPAIDLLNGECVRLRMGEYDTAAKVASDPLETARGFGNCGAKYLHMVDLDGAKLGRPVNDKIVIEVKKKTNLFVEIGGGIRDMYTISYYVGNGIDRIILGSAALTDKALVVSAVERYGGKIAVGIDAKHRRVKTAGWTAESEVDFTELAAEMADAGVRNIIYTDISKDGTLEGVNADHLRELKENLPPDILITASGGIKDMSDIIRLREIDVYGAICGKSIYSGMLDLREAIIEGRVNS